MIDALSIQSLFELADDNRPKRLAGTVWTGPAPVIGFGRFPFGFRDILGDRLTMNADTVQMQGKSSSAQSLIELINDSDYFENASFRGPTRLDSRSGKEIFDINTNTVRQGAG